MVHDGGKVVECPLHAEFKQSLKEWFGKSGISLPLVEVVDCHFGSEMIGADEGQV